MVVGLVVFWRRCLCISRFVTLGVRLRGRNLRRFLTRRMCLVVLMLMGLVRVVIRARVLGLVMIGRVLGWRRRLLMGCRLGILLLRVVILLIFLGCAAIRRVMLRYRMR